MSLPTTTTSITQVTRTTSTSSCELYLAESTIPNAGLGIFTTVPRKKGDPVGYGDVCIPLLDLEWYMFDPEGENNKDAPVDPFGHYVWDGGSMGMFGEVNLPFEIINAFCPGIDAAVNFHPALVNLYQAVPQKYDNRTEIHRWDYPEAAGSFTPYANGTSRAKYDIPAGGELFKDYGHTWFEHRQELFGSHQPIPWDYRVAQKMLYKLHRLLVQNDDNKKSTNSTSTTISIASSATTKDLYQLILDMRDVWEPSSDHTPLLHAFPSDWTLAHEVMTTPATNSDHAGIRKIHQPNATRSIEWLEENGSCMSNIRPQPSLSSLTLLPSASAGRGAFATRSLAQGEIITSSPVLVISHQSILEMYNFKPGAMQRADKIGEQLIKNYCLGHSEISSLLCPYGAGVNLINHNQTLANVRLQWPKDDGFLNHHQARWLHEPLPSALAHETVKLAVQYVATREIQEGEELFLNYGDDWEQAWSRQIYETQHRPDGFLSYISAKTWNEYFLYADTLWTEEENERETDVNNGYPTNLQLRCHDGIIKKRHWAYHRLKWDGDTKSLPEYGHACSVIGRVEYETGKFQYHVKLRVVDDLANGKEVEIEAKNVPRSAIRWFDKPRTTDVHLPSAFRHSIGLPDHMVPEAWKTTSTTTTTTSSTTTSTKSDAKTTSPSSEPKCDLYLAQSTIPNAGLGIFTGRERTVGEHINDFNPAIPLIELQKNHEKIGQELDTYHDPTANYVWDGQGLGMGSEVPSEDIMTYWPGINGAVNCYPVLNNLEVSTPVYDEAGIHRSTHPGAGAFTPYHMGYSIAKIPIPVGGELFKDYGDEYFTSRPAYEGIPVTADFEAVRGLIDSFFNLSKGGGEQLYDMIIDIRTSWGSRTLNALPDTLDDAKLAHEGDIADLHQPKMIRDVSWLQENGRCLDHIVPQRSLLENAGHGAFAKRFLPKGTIISGAPLHHAEEVLFDMYEETGMDQETEDVEYTFSGSQLLLNYCYGHPESSLRLCPYTSGVNYINHNKTLANVKFQWAEDGMIGHNSSWFSWDPTFLTLYDYPSLAFDFVATRDILQGEELYMDYGDEWEAAWIEHSKNWEPEEDWITYESASFWNAKPISNPLRTMDETVDDPYPDNISLRCNSMLTSNETVGTELANLEFYWGSDEYGDVCSIVERDIGEDGLFYYAALITSEALVPTESGESELKVVNIYVERIPRDGFKFFNEPYTTDMHLRRAFRHEIGIPDDMLPKAWRDLPEDEFDDETFTSDEAEFDASENELSNLHHGPNDEL